MKREEICQICGKPAIGYQILVCCVEYVCADHAHPQLLALEPGEKREWGALYFVRYPEPG
ncbi:MAG: hypothetical protein GKC04_07235 [Methanomicrobiales archaeon]|nr:hypothetical protein [Methanomicrobiales archaeon]